MPLMNKEMFKIVLYVILFITCLITPFQFKQILISAWLPLFIIGGETYVQNNESKYNELLHMDFSVFINNNNKHHDYLPCIITTVATSQLILHYRLKYK